MRDPVVRVRTYLERVGAADATFFAAVDAEAEALVTRLRRECLALPETMLAETIDWVYEARSAELADQLARRQAYTASFEDA